jgi:hypothetical protein
MSSFVEFLLFVFTVLIVFHSAFNNGYAAGVKHERARQEMERIEKAKEQKNERSE